MHAVVRTYSSAGAKKLFDVLEERKKDVEDLIRPIKGFVSYSLIRTADGGVSVTVCQDKAGTEESLRVPADWIRQKMRPAPVLTHHDLGRSGHPAAELRSTAHGCGVTAPFSNLPPPARDPSPPGTAEAAVPPTGSPVPIRGRHFLIAGAV